MNGREAGESGLQPGAPVSDDLGDAYEDAFAAACTVTEAALWEVAEAPCSSDADFFAKALYLLEEVHRELAGLFAHDGDFGKLAFAIEMHLEQREGA